MKNTQKPKKNTAQGSPDGPRMIYGRINANWNGPKRATRRTHNATREKDDFAQPHSYDCSYEHREFFNEESLKNLDPAMLALYCNDVTQHNDIDYHTITPQQFQYAIVSATIWHQGQTRANRANFPRTPYIEHPLRNMLRAYRWGITDSDVLAAIILHDTVEDCADKITGYKTREHNAHEQREEACSILEERFSTRVKDLVLAVSNPIMSKEEKKSQTQQQKNEQYAAHLEQVLVDPDVFVVKFSDYIDNAGSLQHQYDENKKEKFSNMYSKYAYALDVFQRSYDHVCESYSENQQDHLEDSLIAIEKNLDKFKRMLDQ